MFTQACFIRKNSEDLRKKLGLIGKRSLCTIHDEILTTYLDCHYSLMNLDGTIDMLSEDGFIDCGTNEELFLAIASVRDDDISLNDKINEINKKYGTKIEFRR